MIENDAFKLLLINLFHLNPDDIANIFCTTFNKMMVLLVTLADKHQACPYCGFTAPKIKEYVTKEITHSALTTQKCIIKYRARRYNTGQDATNVHVVERPTMNSIPLSLNPRKYRSLLCIIF